MGVAVFGVFVVLVEIYFGWARLLAPWGTLPAGQIIAAVALVFVSYWTRAVRQYDYFRDEMSGAFGVCFKVMLQHNLLNNLLPMRSGELSFPVLMARHFDIPVMRSVPALFWFRILDLHTLGACALVAMFAWNVPLMLALLAAWMLLPPTLFWGSGRWLKALNGQSHTRLRGVLKKTLGSLPQTPRGFWRSWIWTVITWGVKLGVFAWVLSLFVDVSAAAALMGVIAGDLTSVLPVHGVAGMGTYEAGVVAGLLPYGVTAQAALPAAVNVHLFLLGSTLVGGAFSLLLGKR
ncbi:MAG: flippase-like domain-containing protein [Gammaproteobacteria bacterium]|nr:flippase-like domain-containing protein [Gammaproteobacteria bacterium]